MKGAQVLGIYPQAEKNIINQKVLNLQTLLSLKAGQFDLVLGRGLSESLGLQIGDKGTVEVARWSGGR